MFYAACKCLWTLIFCSSVSLSKTGGWGGVWGLPRPLPLLFRAARLSPFCVGRGDPFAEMLFWALCVPNVATPSSNMPRGLHITGRLSFRGAGIANAPWQNNNCVAIIDASASRCTNRNVRLISVTFFNVRL